MCALCHLTTLGPCLLHFRSQAGTIHRGISNGNDQFAEKGYLGVEVLNHLKKKKSGHRFEDFTVVPIFFLKQRSDGMGLEK